MNEEEMPTPPELTSNVERVNGFAPGDRVAIVNCELAGAYGKVVDSYHGCKFECRDNCYPVFVKLMSKPEGADEPWRKLLALYGEDVRRFLVREVTHVD